MKPRVWPPWRHGRGGAHHHAGARRRHELVVGAVEVVTFERAGAIRRPQPPAVRAGAEPRALVLAGQHRAHVDNDGRHVGRRSRPSARPEWSCRSRRLARPRRAAAPGDHLLDVHRHQIAQQHRGRERERLVQRHGREYERQRAGHAHAARHRFGDLWRGLVAGVEVGSVDRMPTIGRSSASSVKPAPFRKPRRRKNANSSSPYWASGTEGLFSLEFPRRWRARHCVGLRGRVSQRVWGRPEKGAAAWRGQGNRAAGRWKAGAGKGASATDPKVWPARW